MNAKNYLLGIIPVILSFPVELLSNKWSFLSIKLAQILFWFGIIVTFVLVLIQVTIIIYDFINSNIRTPRKLLFEAKERIDKEREQIKQLLKFDIDVCSFQKLSSHYEELEDSKFSPEALAPLAFEWNEHVESVVHRFNEHYSKEELEKLQTKIDQKEKLLKQTKSDVHYQKSLEQENLSSRKKQFLEEHQNKKFVHAEFLAEEEKTWLEEVGFVRDHQWCIEHKKTEEFLIKVAHNESTSHAYLTGAIYECAFGNAHNVQMLDTKSPDVVFEYGGIAWAIEVETGSVLKKSKKQLLEKIKRLEEKYPKTWFFVVTNKNLVSKYKQFGDTFDRSAIVDHLDSIFYPEGLPDTP